MSPKRTQANPERTHQLASQTHAQPSRTHPRSLDRRSFLTTALGAAGRTPRLGPGARAAKRQPQRHPARSVLPAPRRLSRPRHHRPRPALPPLHHQQHRHPSRLYRHALGRRSRLEWRSPRTLSVIITACLACWLKTSAKSSVSGKVSLTSNSCGMDLSR